jgi:hypothetical protein
MYTLEELKQKSIKELKEIGWELNVLPEGDRRCRINWINALAGVQPTLLQLLEKSPGVELEPIEDAIESPSETFKCLDCGETPKLLITEDDLGKPVAHCLRCLYIFKDYPGVKLEPVQALPETSDTSAAKPITQTVENSINAGVQPPPLQLLEWDSNEPPKPDDFPGDLPAFKTAYLAWIDNQEGTAEEEYQHVTAEEIWNQSGAGIGLTYAQVSPSLESNAGVDRRVQYPNITLQSAFNDEQPPNRGDNGRDRLESQSKVSQRAIALGVFELVPEPPDPLDFPGWQFYEAFWAYYERYPYWKYRDGKCPFNNKIFLGTEIAPEESRTLNYMPDPDEDSPAGKTNPEVSQSAIGLAAKKSLDVGCVYCQSPEFESLRNETYRCYKCQPEMGVRLSDRFLARYSPPQSENIHYQADTDGQLSLLDFEIQTADEPPDPDDFELLEDFRKAIARWDLEHIEVSFDSFCEWAPCPDDWYEPAEVIEPSEVSESPAIESSSTSEFSIPTFDAWCDRPIDTDEPPDTGIFARLPKPKPPGFPPMAIIAGDRANHIKKFARSATLLSGRSPPGGDAMMM